MSAVAQKLKGKGSEVANFPPKEPKIQLAPEGADTESELLPNDPRLFSGYFWQILANFRLFSG